MVLLLWGCFSGASPGQRVSDAARELNLATQFGQMSIALSHVASAVRNDFLQRRAQWGREIRIADVELTGLSVIDEDHALVMVDVGWSPLADSQLRATRLAQEWENLPEGWKLVRERRVAGDLGIFGEVLEPRNTAHPDVHRPSRTLQAN